MSTTYTVWSRRNAASGRRAATNRLKTIIPAIPPVTLFLQGNFNQTSITPSNLNPLLIGTVTDWGVRVFTTAAGVAVALLDVYKLDFVSGSTTNILTSPALASLGWAGWSYPWSGSGYSNSGLFVSLKSTYTLAQMAAGHFVSTAAPGVALTPQSAVKVDAWCVEIRTTF